MENNAFFVLNNMVKPLMLLLSAIFLVMSAQSQVSWDSVPEHIVKDRSPGCGYETAASIDSVLWNDYLDFVLKPDSSAKKTIPKSVYKIPTMFIVDTAGRISLVKAYNNPFEFGSLIEKRLIAFPYKWSPATQNGRPVKSYHKTIIVFNIE